ncbi:serine protease [Pontiellaceae bacterium B12219]|nr:serine protease [Pontiellaceae bacterium B12219]
MNRYSRLMLNILCTATLLFPVYGTHAEDTAPPAFPYTLESIQDNLAFIHVTVNGKTDKHCGFIAEMDGSPYLITSQHFILGATRLRFTSPGGRILKPRSVELSAAHDLVRFALTEGSGFVLANSPEMGEEIAVFGNPDLETSESEIFGKINGLGAEVIEVSAEFDEADSGSPVLNSRKEVVGIASYARESRNHIMKKGTRFENRTRQFCLRFNRIQWKPVNWKKFNAHFGNAYYESQILLDDVITVLNSWSDGPLETVYFEQQPNKTLAGWLDAHNRIVAESVDTGKGRREFYANYSESAEKLASLCSIQARKLRLLTEQRGLTPYIENELAMQAASLEMAADVITRYGISTY